MDYYIKELQDEEFISHDWESLMFVLSIALICIFICTIFHDIYSVKVFRGMVTFGKSKATKVFVI